MAYVQSATGTQNATATTLPIAYASNNVAGNALVCVVCVDGAYTTTGVTDSATNTWTQDVTQTWNFGNYELTLWRVLSAKVGANTVTVTISNANGNVCAIVGEYSNVLTALDKTASAGVSASSNPADSGNTATTTQATELQIGCAASFNGTLTAANGFTARVTISNTGGGQFIILQDKRVTTTGAYKSQTTQGAANQWAAIIATYKETVATLTGTISGGDLESNVVTGGDTLIITIAGDTWVTSGANFNAQRQAIINGITSAQAEAAGWNVEVRAKEVVGAVVRTSNTIATVTFSAEAGYAISANETVTTTVPAAALIGGVALVATPTFVITNQTAVSTTTASFRLLRVQPMKVQ